MHYAELRRAREELTGPGGQFEIVEAEILGQRIRTFKNAPVSLREFWLSTVVYGERTYLVYEGERISYAQAHDQVRAIAAWLAARGIGPGDRVGIAMRNYPEWLLIYWACVSSGIAAVGMNAWWTAEEMDYALADAAPALCSAMPSGWSVLTPSQNATQRSIWWACACPMAYPGSPRGRR